MAEHSRVDPAGTVTEFPELLTPSSTGNLTDGPALTAGPDGAVWFTEPAANRIGRIGC